MNPNPDSILDAGLARHVAGAVPAAAALPDFTKLGAGLLLSSLYGLSLGARESGVDLVRHALGAPLALVVLAALLTPSLAVLFALFDAPITPLELFTTIGRSLASAGLLLAGLAPATALFVVTIEGGALVTTVGRLGCALAFGLAFLQLFGAFWERLALATALTRVKARALLFAYSVFVGLLASRLLATLLPVIGGAS